MNEGRIMKAISGFYYVQLKEAKEKEKIVQCRARGVFKKRKLTPLVGDLVKMEPTSNGEGIVVEVLPRHSELTRPPVANVDQALLVFSMTTPAFSYLLLDRLLVHTEYAGIDAVICLTKADDSEGFHLQDLHHIYGKMGYTVLITSAVSGVGMQELTEVTAGKISVLAGQSGVGKSTMINKLIPGLKLKTGTVSEKLGRGKHTTRHVELIPWKHGGAIADTPGFSQLDFPPDLSPEQLSACFIDFRAHSTQCKFRSCLHEKEPGCAVKEAVAQGKISTTRYENYIVFLQEIMEKNRR